MLFDNVTIDKSVELELSVNKKNLQTSVDRIQRELNKEGSVTYYKDGVKWSNGLLKLDPTKITISRCNDNTIVKIMKDFSYTAAIYYSIVATLSGALTVGLISFLEWPLLAELPLAVCIFIQLLATSRILFRIWVNQKEVSAEELITKVKTILYDSKLNQKEHSYYNQHRA